MTTTIYKLVLQYMFLGFGGQFSFNLNTNLYTLVLQKMLANGLMCLIGFGQCKKTNLWSLTKSTTGFIPLLDN